jgi:hypothetical protein
MFAIPTSHEQGNASPAMNTILSGSKTKSRCVPANAADSIRDSELDSKKIDESDAQHEKHDEQRISISQGIATSLPQPKYRINFDLDESKMNGDSTMKCELPDSM